MALSYRNLKPFCILDCFYRLTYRTDHLITLSTNRLETSHILFSSTSLYP